ncbi:MAG: sugar kinase [Homoserinimonas sp.]|nr:sugar kinase [Homoserinimonas sp.]
MKESFDEQANRIVVFGDVINDIVVVPVGPIRANTDTPSSITQRPGGSASNVASWLGVLGAPVDFVGRVGSGDQKVQQSLFAEVGVEAHLSADPVLPTGSIVVLVNGDDRSMLTERGANKHFTAREVTDELLLTAGIVHFTGYSIFHTDNHEPILELYARTRRAGAVISLDPASAGGVEDFGVERFLELTSGVDMFFPNLDEGRVLTGLGEPLEIAAALGKTFPLTVLTIGRDGIVVVKDGSEPRRFEAIETDAVDPTGAGDAFVAGFLASWRDQPNIEASVALGQEVAARVVAQVGARPHSASR